MIQSVFSAVRVLLGASFVALIALDASQAEPPPEDPSVTTLRLEQALARPVTESFVNTPLEKVVTALSKKMGEPILIDRASLADTEITVSSPVNAALYDVRFESALSLVTEPLGLAWAVRNDVVMIAGPSCSPLEETRFYPIAKLTKAIGGAQSQQRLRRLVIEHVRPIAWDEHGGASWLKLLPNILVASMPARGHAELLQFLSELEQALGLEPRRPTDSKSEQAIQKALDADAQLRFEQTPLTAAIRQIAEQYEVSVVADEEVLAEEGFPPDAPITAVLENVKLGAALNDLLSKLDLAWTTRHEAIWITTKTELENSLVRRFYPVDDLTSRNKPGAIGAQSLLNLLRETVTPTSWHEVGGPGSIGLVGSKLLIVEQTRGSHQELGLQLDRLRQALKLGLAEAKQNAESVQSGKEELCRQIYRVEGVSAEDVATAIQEFVAPESWTDRGGRGAIAAIRANTPLPTRSDILVVRQTDAVHQQIAEFLQELELGVAPQTRKAPMSGSGFF
ncbi:MAG TPA: hypothetical protein VMV10_28700 [Pirellulales bacterium]|nr:hypothetical protein [Pirellulales bacterium]